jgi:hypothetical protein
MNRDTRFARRNELALARLFAQLPDRFPNAVWSRAVSMRRVPDTLSEAVTAYWQAHPLRADRLARALAARTGVPDGWSWTLDIDRRDGLPTHFRIPPAPYREAAHWRGHGFCCVCGQPVYRYGWHRDIWGDGRPSRRATWHQACVAAWKLWTAPHENAVLLKKRQRSRCAVTRKRLLRDAQVDHKVPLFQVWREHRAEPWPDLLAFWGAPNLQVITREAHTVKCTREANGRAKTRRADAVPTSMSP